MIQFKKIYFLCNLTTALISCLLLLFLTSCNSVKQADPPPIWRGVVLGESSQQQVEDLLGAPTRVSEFQRDGKVFTLLGFPSELDSVQHEVLIDQKCSCVTFIIEALTIFAANNNIHASAIQQEYGEPALIMQAATSGHDIILIYPNQGIAAQIRAQANPSEAPLISKYYFEPMSLESYLQSWGKELEIRTEQSVHPDWAPYVYKNVFGP